MAEQPLGVSRREVLRQCALALTAVGSGAFNLEAARTVHALVLERRTQDDGYRPQALTRDEYAVVTRLAELIVPADPDGGSAVDAGAPEFIDLLCSQNEELTAIYRNGLGWVQTAMRQRVGTSFLQASPGQQTALLDAWVEAERAGEIDPGVVFWGWIRRMTVDAYYTSPIGIADLGYQGNTSTTSFEVPADAVEFVSRRIRELRS